MTSENRKMKKILVKDLNPYLTCTLCGGYYIDATSLVDCLHVFCRGCILRYFENSKLGCPTCNTVYKKKNYPYFRPDTQIQSLVYKLVPGLYSKEMQRREDFYRSTGVRPSSSCSDDSVLGDMLVEHDEWMSSYVGDQNQFYSSEDPISLSLEYYQQHLDDNTLVPTSTNNSTKQVNGEDLKLDNKTSELNNKHSANGISDKLVEKKMNNGQAGGNGIKVCAEDMNKNIKIECSKGSNVDVKSEMETKREEDGNNDRRYLQCPAAVSMSHLQKFVRMKYALTSDHRVDIIYDGEVLPSHFSLMDVAYTFNWNRKQPMRFFYRIFTPLKIRPIKIINTSSTGEKQLQIVPIKTTPETIQQETVKNDVETQKEKHLAQLELQSKTKVNTKKTNENKITEMTCVYEYEEPDKEEIKRFAEKRDREWAMQKRLDEQDEVTHHVSKKRKKNKHSKNESVHKKRKLHAEITSNEVLIKEESLKLKVKLTPHNGHKHKHHRSSQNQVTVEVPKQQQQELSSKEKLLQMRAVRHKHISNEEKGVQATPKTETQQQTCNKSTQNEENKNNNKTIEETSDVNTTTTTTTNNSVDTNKTLRTDFTIKTNANNSKELVTKIVNPTVQIERNEQTEKQAQKTFLKTFPSHTEKINKNSEKVVPVKTENTKVKSSQNPYVALGTSTNALHKSLEQKIASLQQQCTIEAKNLTQEPTPPTKTEKKVSFANEKPKILNSQYPAGFTVSKIEAGGKRKLESDEQTRDKRPSLEITLINPSTTSVATSIPPAPSKIINATTTAKRPPPATIPLDRIRKSINLNKSGISIIPKMPEKCDNIGALDLSKPNKTNAAEIMARSSEYGKANGLNMSGQQRQQTSSQSDKNVNMANLQMLSKVAIEHHKMAQGGKPRPELPALQTLKIPIPQNSNINKQHLPKLPKLNEINKMQFRMSAQMRNMRQNQNQSIRDIPNPSWLIRQQNQNRMNSINSASVQQQNNNGNETKEGSSSSKAQNGSGKDSGGEKTATSAIVQVEGQKEKAADVTVSKAE